MKYFYIKLGGSYLTSKSKIEKKPSGLNEIIEQIKKIYKTKKNIILGHGAGSYPHYIATKFKLKHGKNKIKNLYHLIIDEFAVEEFHYKIMEKFVKKKVPVMGFSPRNLTYYNEKKGQFIINYKPVRYALDNNIIPMVYGDNILSNNVFFYLLSTEDIFEILMKKFPPEKIVFITDTLVKDVYGREIYKVDRKEILKIKDKKDKKFDVTGGMMGKIKKAFEFSKKYKVKVKILNGNIRDNLIKEVLYGKGIGTEIIYKE